MLSQQKYRVRCTQGIRLLYLIFLNLRWLSKSIDSVSIYCIWWYPPWARPTQSPLLKLSNLGHPSRDYPSSTLLNLQHYPDTLRVAVKASSYSKAVYVSYIHSGTPWHYRLKERNLCKQLTVSVKTGLFVMHLLVLYEPHREKTGFLHVQKQRHRSASRYPRSWSAPLFSLHG